ncbi:MAG: hypothetical protein GYA57_14180 [Myxococcales bacterium]|nr:hypothetical protein [Myxococcales bacterium]
MRGERNTAAWVTAAIWAAVCLALGAGCSPSDDTVPDARDDAGASEDADVLPDDGDATDADASDAETSGSDPRLASVSPPSGPTAGGTLVTLYGENFAADAAVTFDGLACTGLVVHTARRMTCRTPAHAAGAVDVTVVNTDGRSATLAAAFEYDDAATPRVNWCILHYPPELWVEPDAAAGPIYGRVYVESVTPGAGAGAGVRGQIGIGVLGSDPAGWTWAEATYNVDVDGIVPGDRANDEYAASLLGRAEGDYYYAYRFSLDDGETWLLCDRTGSDDGFDVALAGTLHVLPAPPPSIAWCAIDRPAAATAEKGGDPVAVFARVHVPRVTAGVGPGPGVTAELGRGVSGVAPDAAGWTWTAMTYVADIDGLVPGDLANDEYQGALAAPDDAGEYLYAARFSLDGGTTWTYCDTAGPIYSEVTAGRLTVTEPGTGPLVGWCNLQWPSSLTVAAGATSEPVYGRVWAAGVTPGAGRGAGIRGQVGYGSPSADPATWTWTEADFNVDVDGLAPGDLANDEYWQRLTATTPGTYAYAYRFTMDDGRSWRYCDLDGAAVGEFSIAQAGTLTVE